MIFVTVGTHEQQFNRIVQYMDEWAKCHSEEVVIQSGYSTYTPKYATWKKLFPSSEMRELMERARIVITHGGPASFMMPLQLNKTPIVVPRQFEYGEHVNNHQLNFCRQVECMMKNIILVEDVDALGDIIEKYDELSKSSGLSSNNAKFCADLDKIICNMMEGK